MDPIKQAPIMQVTRPPTPYPTLSCPHNKGRDEVELRRGGWGLCGCEEGGCHLGGGECRDCHGLAKTRYYPWLMLPHNMLLPFVSLWNSSVSLRLVMKILLMNLNIKLSKYNCFSVLPLNCTLGGNGSFVPLINCASCSLSTSNSNPKKGNYLIFRNVLRFYQSFVAQRWIYLNTRHFMFSYSL